MCATGERRTPNRARSRAGAVRAGCAALALLAASTGAAQEPGSAATVADVPAVERHADHFYNAIAAGGGGVKVLWSATPADNDIALTLTVRGAANPGELLRPDLRAVPAFAERFQILDAADTPTVSADEVRFAYRVRARTADATAVPSLTYRYYRPGFPDGRRMQTAYADAIPLPAPAPPTAVPAPPTPLAAPSEFLSLAEESPWELGYGASLFAAVLAVALIPVAVVGWVLVWRRLWPDAARRAAIRRERAARVALARLAAARRSADPAGDAADAVLAFFAARIGVPPYLRTPAEIADALLAAGENAARADEAERFFRACDAARFAPPGNAAADLVDEAERIVESWTEERG